MTKAPMNAAPSDSGSTPLVLLRHGRTEWNLDGRIQGQTDTRLSAPGRDQVLSWRLPPELAGYRWVSSPLARSRETAALLGHEAVELEAALMEARWGRWEGERLVDLRARHGPDMAALERRGLDFQPPEGESPRDVQARLRPWLEAVARHGQPTVAVCHRGVIRALYALATGWDMTGKPSVKIGDDSAHRFTLDRRGVPTVVEMNVGLRP